MRPFLRHIRHLVFLFGLSVAFILGGCSKVTKSNYDKVETGMTQQQVEDILGPGTPTQSVDIGGSGAKQLQWKDGDKTITVTIVNGKVTLKNASGL